MDTTVDTFEKVCEKLGKNHNDYTVNPDWDSHEKYAMGIRRLLLIHKFFQNGKIDFADDDQEKWFPCFWRVLDASGRLSGFLFFFSAYSHTSSSSVLGPLLRFHDEETSEYVGKTFTGEFEAVLMLENDL